ALLLLGSVAAFSYWNAVRLEERDDVAAATARRTTWVTLGGSLISLGFVGLAGYLLRRDALARGRAEEALQASEQRARLIIDNANHAFVAISADARIIDWNRQAEATFGWPRE